MALANVFFTRIITGLGGSIFQQILACRWEFHEQRFQHPGSISGDVIGYWSKLFQRSVVFSSRQHSCFMGCIPSGLAEKKREVEMEKEAGRPSWGWPWKKFFVLLDPSFS